MKSLSRVHSTLAHLAPQDGLTGLANRRSFDEMLSLHHRTATDTGGKLSLIMIDVDWFKSFNDRYGHPTGDDCLRQVSETIMTSIRQPRDIAARYGGEEFAILLPKTDEVGAALVAERIRQSVARLALVHDASPAGLVTISAGVASVDGDADGHDSESLLRSADRALYAAKRNGRNRVSRSSLLGLRGQRARGPAKGEPGLRDATDRVARGRRTSGGLS